MPMVSIQSGIYKIIWETEEVLIKLLEKYIFMYDDSVKQACNKAREMLLHSRIFLYDVIAHPCPKHVFPVSIVHK